MFRIHYLTLFCITAFLKLSLSLVELPKVKDNEIFKAEAVIRGTANLLFSQLKIKEKYFKSPFKQYFIAHNCFISITLKDYVNLEEIVRHTRVDKNDELAVFMDILNEILNEGSDNEAHEALRDDDVVNTFQSLLKDIPYGGETQNNTPANAFNNEIVNEILNANGNWTDESGGDIFPEDYDDATNETSFESEVWLPEPNTRRVYKGRMTKIKRYPFMAVVQLFGQFYCAGSIIAQDLVVTAASCVQLAWNNRFFRENPAFLSVRVGSSFFAGGGEVINVQEVYFHPTYNPKTLKDNICVLRLIRLIKFGKGKAKGKNKLLRRVKRIEIDTSPNPLPITTAGVTILGWGARDSSNIIKSAWANRLSYSVLDIYAHHDCKAIYTAEYVGPRTFCAGFISKGGGACNRDVGGPGVVNGVLVGVVSFGSAVCGVPDYPTVFTKVGFYADWLEEIMDMDVPVKSAATTLTTRFAYTSPVVIETTPFVMKPIGDVGDIYIDALDHDVLRNRIPEVSDEHNSSSIEIDILANDTDLIKPILTTSIITYVPSTDPTVSKEESSESMKTTKKTKKLRKKKDKKSRFHETPNPETELEMEEEPMLNLEPVWDKEEEENEEKQLNLDEAYESNFDQPKYSLDDTIISGHIEEETIESSQIIEYTTKSIKKKKRLRKGKKKKMKKELKTTTKMTSVRKKTTPEVDEDSFSEPIEKTDSKKDKATSQDEEEVATTTFVDNNNPLDTLSQKEFYALLAEVLDKLERDTSKDTDA